MSKELKLFFDNTSSPKLPRLLRDFYAWDYAHLKAIHLRERFDPGDDDPVWLSQLSAEGGWIVVSEDRAKSSRKMPLPIICEHLRITHVLVSKSLKRFEDMKQAIAECWREIVALSEMKPGTRAMLRYRGFHSDAKKAVLLVGDEKVQPTKRRIAQEETKPGAIVQMPVAQADLFKR